MRLQRVARIVGQGSCDDGLFDLDIATRRNYTMVHAAGQESMAIIKETPPVRSRASFPALRVCFELRNEIPQGRSHR